MPVLLILLLLAFVPDEKPTARLERDIRTRYYDVQGTTAQALLRDLRAKRPGAFFGQTAYEVGFTYRIDQRGDACTVIDATVTLTAIVTLPRWQPSGDAPAELQRDWARFIRRLERHEREHIRLSEQAARDVRDMLATARGTCGDLKPFIDKRARRILASYDYQNEAYDEQTEHGVREGVRWPL